LVKSASIVLEDIELATEVCGANDANLKVLEGLLGGRILSRGNELLLEHGDEQERALFKDILKELTEHASKGRSPGPDLVRAVHASLSRSQQEDVALLREMSIHIPGGFGSVHPRSGRQAAYMVGMDNSDVSFCTGPAGTGKTFLAVAQGLRAVLSRKKRKLVLTRPVVEAGESLGFLPGDLAQKLSPYLRPLYDSMESLVPMETIQRMEDNRIMEIAPLAYMRGRSLKDCFVILDEAQNTTRAQMKMFLTRIGEGSSAVITGDTTQIDLPRPSDSGLLEAVRVLSLIKEIHFSAFTEEDVVRHPLVRKIIQAYDAQG
jgi:phosphate starvation-inducible PhoH-like protein